MTAELLTPPPEIPLKVADERGELITRLDELLEQYLELLDQYMKAREQSSSFFSSVTIHPDEGLQFQIE